MINAREVCRIHSEHCNIFARYSDVFLLYPEHSLVFTRYSNVLSRALSFIHEITSDVFMLLYIASTLTCLQDTVIYVFMLYPEHTTVFTRHNNVFMLHP